MSSYIKKCTENDQTIADKNSKLASQEEELQKLTQAKNNSEA